MLRSGDGKLRESGRRSTLLETVSTTAIYGVRGLQIRAGVTVQKHKIADDERDYKAVG